MDPSQEDQEQNSTDFSTSLVKFQIIPASHISNLHDSGYQQKLHYSLHNEDALPHKGHTFRFPNIISKYKAPNALQKEEAWIPRNLPLLLMLDRDFIVTAPVPENLILKLVLKEGKNNGQILAGRFEAFCSFLHFNLCAEAKRVASESNAGGSSTISESLSVEYFVRKFDAQDVVTEMEVEYCSLNWKKVDYICNLYGERVGVSVTRAMSYPQPQKFSPQMAHRLLHKKLFGLVVARHGVTERHSFSQCILHVWCETKRTAEIVRSQYKDKKKFNPINSKQPNHIFFRCVGGARHSR